MDPMSPCVCHNITYHTTIEMECKCSGSNLYVPTNLTSGLIRLLITDGDIDIIKKNDFDPYRETLAEVMLINLHSLRVIERGSFRDMPNLSVVHISQATQLTYVNGLFDGVTSARLRVVKIVSCNLVQVPDFSHLNEKYILQILDLDHNNIEHIKPNSLKVRAEQVTINHNKISVVDDYAFNGSTIATLSLRSNRRLTKIYPNAFSGLNNLLELDLSESSLMSIPIAGLEGLETLKIRDTPSLKVIPSIYDFPRLEKAYLTHHFHCCAFKYPEQHNPWRHAQYENRMRQFCNEQDPSAETDTGQGGDKPVRKKRSAGDSIPSEGSWAPHVNYLIPINNSSSNIFALRGSTIAVEEAKPMQKPEIIGSFHSATDTDKHVPITAACGQYSLHRSSRVKCYPEPNALNPCEDIMGSYYLRISVWFVVILAMLGNLAVIIVIIFSSGEVTVSRFLICNLAFADFCMGLYLLLIASMDLHSVGTYFNSAFDWQYGLGCQMAGFLTVFASQLSIFTLTVVTVERWFAIAYAMYLTRRLRLGLAAKIMLAGWIYSIFMAVIPLLGVSNYSSTSICLPMEVNRTIDKAYLISIIVINGLAFALIVFCYAHIYFSLGYETRRCSTKGEMTIAKKMALLVFTDFVCWAPIAFFSLTALAGYPLIGITRSKILLVFFYPLNSCANPYLYAIMTAQYRKDFFTLLYRCGIWTKKTKQYALNSSMPTTNNSHPVPLLTKTSQNNGVKQHVDDAFV
ncbi:hypothetical protein Trydic_g22166 [Trypoxylus dichotomus]